MASTIHANGLPFGVRPSSSNDTAGSLARPMYRFQTKLPRLPVPPLSQTLKSYLHHLEPLVSTEVFQQAKQDVTAFATSDDAQLLQRYVLELAAHPATENWLHQWWEDSYLTDRTPLAINVSPTIALEPCCSSTVMGDQCLRAAIVLHHTIQYRQSISTEKMEPGTFKGKPFCMRDYSYTFNSCRVPLVGKDTLVSFPLSTHVVVMCRGRMYRLEAFNLNNGEVRSVQSFFDALTFVKTQAMSVMNSSMAQGLGALTCGERNQWALARAELLSASAKNQLYLRHIEEAICILSLDVDSNPKPFTGNMIKCLLGGGHTRSTAEDTESSGEKMITKVPYVDRWHDKSFHVHITANGIGALSFEHSGQDSLPPLGWTNYIWKAEKAGLSLYEGLKVSSFEAESAAVVVQELIFDLPAQVVRSRDLGLSTLQTTLSNLDAFVANVHNDFGTTKIRAKLRCSPDALVQMVLQVAFHQCRGSIASTYESCATKTFLRGRTETIRTPTMTSKKFCEAYLENKLSPKEMGLLLRSSMTEHGKYAKMCLEGQGSDRHLFALSMAAQELGRPVPTFLQDSSFKTYSKILLSTTHPLAIEGCGGCCFGPINPQSIGVAYQCFSDHIFFTVTTNNNGLGAAALKNDVHPHEDNSGEAAKFGQLAMKAMMDFHEMLEATVPPHKKPSKL